MQRGDVFPYPRVFRWIRWGFWPMGCESKKRIPIIPRLCSDWRCPPGLGSCVPNKALALLLGTPKRVRLVEILSYCCSINSSFLANKLLQCLSHFPIWNLSLWSVAAAKSLQSCPILCDPREGSPPGSAVPGILQARTMEWVAISFSMHESEKWKWSRSVVSDSSDPMNCSPPGSSIHGIFQAKVLEWGAIAFSVWSVSLH